MSSLCLATGCQHDKQFRRQKRDERTYQNLSDIFAQSCVKRPKHLTAQLIMSKLSLPFHLNQTRGLQFFHVVGKRCRAYADTTQDRTALQASTLVAQPRQDFVTPRIAQRLGNGLHLLLTQFVSFRRHFCSLLSSICCSIAMGCASL